GQALDSRGRGDLRPSPQRHCARTRRRAGGASMSDLDRNYAATPRGFADRAAIDAGLRAHMIRVYNYMAIGVALTGLVAWATFQAAGGDAIRISAGTIAGLTPFGAAVFQSPLMWVLMLAPLGLVLVLSFGINRLSAPAAQAL